MCDVVALDRIERAELLIVAAEDENHVVFEEAGRVLTPGHVQFYAFVAVPLVFFYIVDLTALQLHLFYVFKAAHSIDFLTFDSHRRKERFFLEHRRLMNDVLVFELHTVETNTSNQEPTAYIRILHRLEP